MKTAKGGKGKTTKKAPKKTPKKVVKKAVKKAPAKKIGKKPAIAAHLAFSFSPKDLEMMKETMREVNIPKEIREVFDTAKDGNAKAFRNAVEALPAKRLQELVGAIDWSSETGLQALEKLGKDAKAFADGVIIGELPSTASLAKCCCDPRIFPEMQKLCRGLCLRCCCCCCDWDDFCRHLCCHCGILIYSFGTLAARHACALSFSKDFKVEWTKCKATISLNSSLYYTKTEVDAAIAAGAPDVAGEISALQTDVGNLQTDVGTLQSDVGTLQSEMTTHTHAGTYCTPSDLSTGLATKSDTSHNHTGTYATPSDLSTGLATKSDTSHNHTGTYATPSDLSTGLATKSDTSHNHTGVYATPSDLSTGLATKSDSGHAHAGTYETVANVTALGNRVTATENDVTALKARKNVITIDNDFTIHSGDTYPYTVSLSALTAAYGEIHVSVSGVLNSATSTNLADWLRFTWSVDSTKTLHLHLWSQAGSECDPSDPAWDGKNVYLKITAVG